MGFLWGFDTALQIQHSIQAAVHADQGRDAPDRKERADTVRSRAAARVVPEGGYMIETDAPYLAPVPNRGKRCEPAYVADTARAIATLRGQSVEKVAADTTRTALAFFRGWN